MFWILLYLVNYFGIGCIWLECFMQTLLLASAIIRLLWSMAQSRALMSATRYHGEHMSQPLPQYYTMIDRRSSQSPEDGDVELAG